MSYADLFLNDFDLFVYDLLQFVIKVYVVKRQKRPVPVPASSDQFRASPVPVPKIQDLVGPVPVPDPKTRDPPVPVPDPEKKTKYLVCSPLVYQH